MGKSKNSNLRKANQQIPLTEHQQIELLRCQEDPIYFIEHYCITINVKDGVVPFILRPYQTNLITTFKDNDLSIVLSARQTGKSWSAAAYLLWYACFEFHKDVLIASNKNDNAMEMIHRIREMYEHLPNWIKPGLADDGWNKHSVKFDNKCRIVSTATAPNSGRGLTVALLFLDEFRFVAPNVQEAFWTSMAPTLATGGKCIIASTPNGDSDLFSQLWRGSQIPQAYGSKIGSNGFAPVRVYWDEPPGRDRAFKEKEIGKIGERKWLQEYECEFLSSDALLFDSLALLNQTKVVEQIKPIHIIDNDLVWFKQIQPRTTYLVGVDPATGSGKDYSVIEVFDFPLMEQVCEFRSNTTSPAQVYFTLKKIIQKLEKLGSNVMFTVENNGIGQSIVALYEADEYPPELAQFVSETGKNRYGMTTTGKTKMKSCLAFKEMFERSTIHVKSPILLKEMKEFVRKAGSYQARAGATDDCVMSAVLCIRLVEEMATYDPERYDKIFTHVYESFRSQQDDEAWDDSDGPLGIVIG